MALSHAIGDLVIGTWILIKGLGGKATLTVRGAKAQRSDARTSD